MVDIRTFVFSDNDLLRLVHQLHDSEDPVAHLLSLVRATRRTAMQEFSPDITASVLECHDRLEAVLRNHLRQTGWDLDSLRSPSVSH